jgi:Microcystin-dependent protein
VSDRWAWLTPGTLPETKICRELQIPSDCEIVAAVNGALWMLTQESSWEQDGGVTPAEIAAAMSEMWEAYLVSECGGGPAVGRVGTIFAHLRDVEPEGSLPLSGGIYAKAMYPDLWDVLHPNFEYSDTHFQLPNLNGKLPMGTVPPEIGIYAMGAEGGANAVTLTVAQIPPHKHLIHRSNDIYTALYQWSIDRQYEQTDLLYETAETGGGEAHENRPPFIAFYYAVWYE